MLKLKLELLSHLAQNAKFSCQSADFVLADLIDKVGDVKNGAVAQETLSCISEACTLEFVSEQVKLVATIVLFGGGGGAQSDSGPTLFKYE